MRTRKERAPRRRAAREHAPGVHRGRAPSPRSNMAGRLLLSWLRLGARGSKALERLAVTTASQSPNCAQVSGVGPLAGLRDNELARHLPCQTPHGPEHWTALTAPGRSWDPKIRLRWAARTLAQASAAPYMALRVAASLPRRLRLFSHRGRRFGSFVGRAPPTRCAGPPSFVKGWKRASGTASARLLAV